MRTLLFVALLGAAALAGCTPGVEKTCEKLVTLSREDAAKRGAPFPAEKEAKTRDKCLVEMREREARDRDAYACVADCFARTDDLLVAKTCLRLCDGPDAGPKTAASAP